MQDKLTEAEREHVDVARRLWSLGQAPLLKYAQIGARLLTIIDRLAPDPRQAPPEPAEAPPRPLEPRRVSKYARTPKALRRPHTAPEGNP